MSLRHQILTQPVRPNPIIVDNDTYLDLIEIDSSTKKMRYKMLDNLNVNGEIIETRCIIGFAAVHNFAEYNAFVMPPKVKINRDNLKMLREMKLTMQGLKDSGEKFDPCKHMPAAWVEAAGKVGLDLDSNISVADQGAINDGRARVDEHGYVVYDYSRQLLHDNIERRKMRGERFNANMMQVIAEQGP